MLTRQNLPMWEDHELACHTDGTPVSFAELWRASSRAMATITAHYDVRRRVVGLTVRDEYLHFVIAIALLRLGSIQVVLPSYESSAYRQVLAKRCDVSLQIVGPLDEPVPGIDHFRFLDLGGPAVGIEASHSPPGSRSEEEGSAPCIYFVSSGTTGRLKIIPLSYDDVVAQARHWQLPMRRDIFWRPTPIEYNNSKRQRLYGLLTGTVNVFATYRPGSVLDLVRRHGITRLNLSVMQARGLLACAQEPTFSFPDSCHVRIGGSAVDLKLRRALETCVTPNLHVTYATSESGSIATACPGDHGEEGCVGSLHQDVEVEIVDASDRPMPYGRVGHIRVRSPGMARCYLDDPDATLKGCRGGWFYPGDMGRFDRIGRLFVVGRSDDMMSLASINIFPSEIEAAYADIEGVIECAAFALKSSSFGDIPVLAVVCDDSVDLEALRRLGKDRLGIRAARKIFRVEQLPRNAGGKILRDGLSKREWT